jgi:hypothetical protein
MTTVNISVYLKESEMGGYVQHREQLNDLTRSYFKALLKKLGEEGGEE